ncbi:MAG: hypothetical protein CFH06_00519 [Alphaproteobacteria bacterium MarineAlpha3_Bin5]|nr:hypothetical protein [Magnetovibrio sp.]PPR79087.1 MAG: hypothetical protein CFH06_00519 [Alphaproteobacteria bacterium MarineAlpha3_Bin5]
MSYLALGLALLAGILLAAKWFVNADPRIFIKFIKWILFGIIACVGLYFVLTGRGAWALAVLPAALPYLLRIRSLARTARMFSQMHRGGRTGSSEVRTKLLHMQLDHGSGKITGEVISGAFTGRKIEQMSLAELILLNDECEKVDSEGARIIRTFLDRENPGWDNFQKSKGSTRSSGKTTDMDREEALEILGLPKNASKQHIREAYHRLITNLHPDRGGSTYLAAQINRAKEVLLDDG